MAKAPDESPDYNNWDTARLIARVSDLERQLKEQATALQSANASLVTSLKPATTPPPPKRRPPRPFDHSKYTTRHIALKFAYLGQRYNGYEHHNGNLTPLPTVEGVLWQALRKGYLILPQGLEGLNKNEISWEGCDYSKCGRTDRGVSAFGQVVGVRVRSRRPPHKEVNDGEETANANHVTDGEPGTAGSGAEGNEQEVFDPILDEIPYVQILNSLLPPDIHVLAWCPSPPPKFSARFSCKERRYRYFFTQPAFAPTPGYEGLYSNPGSKRREGWLDIEAMREGARHLIGLHDFRNFCKTDASKQITNFERRIFHAGIEAVDPRTSPVGYVAKQGFRQFADADTNGQQENEGEIGEDERPSSPQIYSFNVNGSAFLWHQVRCMVAILFLIGQGLEAPSLVSKLLNVKTNPRKPTYEMATDAPLVLWDCIFPIKDGDERVDGLDWIYVGEDPGAKSQPGRSDGKFGLGGVVDDLWATWRQRKMEEVLAGSLLDIVVGQRHSRWATDNTFNASIHSNGIKPKTQKLFEGRDSVRVAGKYVSVMQKPLMEAVEAQNAKYLARKGRAIQPSEDSDDSSIVPDP